MRKWILLLLSSLWLCGCSDPETVTLSDGSTLAISSKKYMAVNYWAGWCEPCREEAPELNKLSRSLSDKLQVLGVNYDQKTGPSLHQDMQRLGVLYPVVITDVAQRWHLPEPQVLPTTYLLSPDHKVIKSFYGQDGVQELRSWFSSK